MAASAITRLAIVYALLLVDQVFVSPWSLFVEALSRPNVVDSTKRARFQSSKSSKLKIGDLIGSGSYGTVHLGEFEGDYAVDSDSSSFLVCKRAWKASEIDVTAESSTTAKDREDRCNYYFNVEKHCFEKMEISPLISEYIGTFLDTEHGYPWMTFSMIATPDDTDKPAPSLADVMRVDWTDQHNSMVEQPHHRLTKIQDALGMNPSSTFADVLDRVFLSLLEGLSFIHSQGIVHGDVKPGNLLLDATTQSFVLIDFGSAADMDPVKGSFFGKKLIGLDNENRVAVSPIYSAPEVFIRPDRYPFQFDVFSAALIFCQLLFNYLDIRTDAGFHQQLEAVHWDLDSWLSRALSAKVRPAWMDDALEYLSVRPGMWRLLGRMFQKDPYDRINSASALSELKNCIAGRYDLSVDGLFFESIISFMESCDIEEMMALDSGNDMAAPMVQPRPLHFVATFSRLEPLGLVLAEPGQEYEGREKNLAQWIERTKDAPVGAVFVQDILDYSQADELGVIEVGDQLQGVGELPLMNRGFESVVSMLENQPRSSKKVTLHFDRQSERMNVPAEAIQSNTDKISIVDEGAWSATGRRKAQEDAFVLHDIDNNGDLVLLAGVFDGHAGRAASKHVATSLPTLFTKRIRGSSMMLTNRQALEQVWEDTCNAYRDACVAEDECVADYDAREGVLLANTGSSDFVAGTTAAAVVVEADGITVLNCGDSRTLLVSSDGSVVYSTVDHSPQNEMSRLRRGQSQGLDYSLPECSLSRWFLQVGDMQYAVCRSLEGPFATAKGIVSDPDIATIRGVPGGVLVLATDGIFEVMDNKLVARIATMSRTEGLSAGETAKSICSTAIDKDSSDNCTVIVIYLQ